MSTYRLTSTDEPETVTIPEQSVAVIIPATEITLTPRDWKVERDGAWIGSVSIQAGTPPWLAIWFSDGPYAVSSTHQSRDEAIAAVVAGSDR